jgi:hypothetical protein
VGRWLGARPSRCAEWGLPFGRQGHSLRSCPADSLRSRLTAGPAALVLAVIGEGEPRAAPEVGGSFPVAETLSTAEAAVLTLVVLSAPALPFRDGSKEHQGEGGWVGRFVGPHVAGGARRAFTLRPARVHDADGPPAKRRTEASATRRD